MNEQKAMCPLTREPCTGDQCAVGALIIPSGEPCPFAIEPEALEAVKDALLSAARYADEVSGISALDNPDPNILKNLGRAIREGKVDLAKLLGDLLSLEE